MDLQHVFQNKASFRTKLEIKLEKCFCGPSNTSNPSALTRLHPARGPPQNPPGNHPELDFQSFPVRERWFYKLCFHYKGGVVKVCSSPAPAGPEWSSRSGWPVRRSTELQLQESSHCWTSPAPSEPSPAAAAGTNTDQIRSHEVYR